MGHRLSKIYTRTGDQGTTALGDGARVDKDDLRVEAFGTVDELNSALGMVLAHPDLSSGVQVCLTQIQHELFDLGGELCIPDTVVIKPQHISRLESELDTFNEPLPYLKEFILPGGHPAAATCHLARTICRRAERRLVTLQKHAPINIQSLIYLNRLSDLLFVIARVINHEMHYPEPLWQHKREKI